jgi:hypothetical protein
MLHLWSTCYGAAAGSRRGTWRASGRQLREQALGSLAGGHGPIPQVAAALLRALSLRAAGPLARGHRQAGSIDPQAGRPALPT